MLPLASVPHSDSANSDICSCIVEEVMTIILAIGHTAPFFGPCGLRTNWCSQKSDGKCCTQLTLIFLLKTGRHGMGAPGAYTYVLIRRWN